MRLVCPPKSANGVPRATRILLPHERHWKSFNRFEGKDFERAKRAAELFPGAILCFCTFNDSLEPTEVKGLKKIATVGRDSLDVGLNRNPVLILTGRELFGQFHFGEFSELYGTDSQLARHLYMGSEIRELCEFTQRLYLGMPSSHDVHQAHRIELYRLASRKNALRRRKTVLIGWHRLRCADYLELHHGEQSVHRFCGVFLCTHRRRRWGPTQLRPHLQESSPSVVHS